MRNRPPGGFASGCGRVVCVHTCGSVHSPCRGVASVFRIAYGWAADEGEGPDWTSGTLVTASPSDRPSQSVVLCHGLGCAVQSEVALGPPTPWTSPFARRPAAGATASLRSVRRATVAMPTARHAAGPRPAGARLLRPRFFWTRIKGESDVQGGSGNGSVEEGAGSWVGADEKPWRELVQMASEGEADVALLQEAGSPPGAPRGNEAKTPDRIARPRHTTPDVADAAAGGASVPTRRTAVPRGAAPGRTATA